MKVLIFCTIFIAAHAVIPDCTRFKCIDPFPLECPEDSVLIENEILPGGCCPRPGRCMCNREVCLKKECAPGYSSILVSKGSGKPGKCCDVYECKLDCSTVKCEKPLPLSCPDDSVLIEGITAPDQCCPQKSRCDCKPAGCKTKECQPGYFSLLASKGSGKPGECCDVFKCVLDCRTVKCGKPLPPSCPEDSVLIEGITPPDQCCPQNDRCDCKPAGCTKKECQPGYISVLASKGSGKPGECCDVFKCELDCSTVRCEKQLPPSCPEDSVLIVGITQPGQCCPTPSHCECKAGCLKKVCQSGYRSVLVSKGSGTPGNCCDIYKCEIDCTMVRCAKPLPIVCPKDSVLIEEITSPDQCCSQPGRCKCLPGCSKKQCSPSFSSILVSKGTGTPGSCCDVYECKPVCYTQWFDRDDPSATGDHETLNELRKEYPEKICSKPLTIQATTLSGVPSENIGQVIKKYDTTSGFACLNSQQRNGECCLDYKVRFECPCPWPNK